MGDESKHPTEVPGYEGKIDELVKNLGNLDYRTLRTIVEKLGDEFLAQCQAEDRRGRERLADALDGVKTRLYSTVDSLDKVCKICKPYMES